MKRLSIVFIAMFLFIVNFGLNAQTKSGFDYFKGKWNVTVEGPNGETKMFIEFSKTGDTIMASIKSADGKEMYKVNRTEVKEERAVIYFTGSQGNDVDLALNKKDASKVSGVVMGIFSATGERVKE